jgi:hypothetical protein
VRLDRRDIEGLIDRGRIDAAVRFGPASGLAFSYAVEVGAVPRNRPTASYVAGRLSILIDDAEAWRDGDREGFDHEQVVDGGLVRVLLEKDFACFDRPVVEESDDAWAFPNPSAVCERRTLLNEEFLWIRVRLRVRSAHHDARS